MMYISFMGYFEVASIVLISKSGLLILQLRDEKADIRNPGMISAWGGAVEGDETPLQAAKRETHEETNLRPSEDDFEYFAKYPRDHEIDGKQVINYVYLLREVDESKLKVYEGQGFELIHRGDFRPNPKYTELTIKLIADLP